MSEDWYAQQKKEKAREAIILAFKWTAFLVLSLGGLAGVITGNVAVGMFLSPWLLILSAPAGLFVYIWSMIWFMSNYDPMEI